LFAGDFDCPNTEIEIIRLSAEIRKTDRIIKITEIHFFMEFCFYIINYSSLKNSIFFATKSHPTSEFKNFNTDNSKSKEISRIFSLNTSSYTEEIRRNFK
jgi:hypothetical protein